MTGCMSRLDYGEPVTILDAATGERLSTVGDTDGARELVLKDGTLFVLADDMTAAQHNERRDRISREFLRTSPELDIWQRLPRGTIPMYGTQRIVAIKTGDGSYARQSVDVLPDSPPSRHGGSATGDGSYRLLWKKQFDASGEVMPTTMAVDDGRVCLQTVSHVVCVDAIAGKELWRSERPVAQEPFLLVHTHLGHS